ncbi:MAG: rod shape-determining protein MreC [Ruminococcaceae bacterium]|nr:rod shape-determining protein MreC [Oscillospiraceae bacterium]
MQFFKNKFTLFLCIVILFLLGCLLYSLTTDNSTVIEGTGGTVVTVPQKGSVGIGGFINKFVERFTNYENIKQENEELKKQIKEYEDNIADAKRHSEENEELKSLLEIKEKNPNFVFEEAKVIAKDPGDWFFTFTIDKGSMHGVKAGQPVITSDGLVGKIKTVSLTYSKVVSIIDTECVTGAMVVRTGDAAVVEGDFLLSQSGLCKLSFFDNMVNLNRGDIIDTSGLGGVFPSGIRIGRVEDILPEENGISNYAIVRPAVNFEKIRNVFIIKSFEIEESTDEAEDVSSKDSN